MNLFGNYYSNAYEELASYYPDYYRDVYEMQEILKSQGNLLDGLVSGFQRVFDNQFIDTADSEMLSVYEKILGIIQTNVSLEERRSIIKAYLTGTGKVSGSMICQMISAYTGTEAECSFDQGDYYNRKNLIITAKRGSRNYFNLREIYSMLSAKLPAHISYKFDMTCESGIEIKTEYSAHSNILPNCGVYCSGQEGVSLCN